MRWLRPALVLLLLSATGCAKGTYLEINFTGPAALPAVRLQLDLTLTGPGGSPVTTSHDLVPALTESAVKLPVSMALKLDDDSGSLHIAATAIDSTPKVVGMGMNTTMIMHAETWTVEIPIHAVAATP